MQSNTLSWNDKKVAQFLLSHKVILAPSDTVWGLCGVVCQEVFDELGRLKVRNDKPYLVLACSVDEVKKYGVMPEGANFRGMLEKIWPGPVTVILHAAPTAPPYMVSPEGTIAFRVPAHQGLQQLLRVSPVLFSTSANISGQLVPEKYSEIDFKLKKEVAACILPEGHEKQGVVPSTIISLVGGTLKLVREGVVPYKELQALVTESQ